MLKIFFILFVVGGLVLEGYLDKTQGSRKDEEEYRRYLRDEYR